MYLVCVMVYFLNLKAYLAWRITDESVLNKLLEGAKELSTYVKQSTHS